MAREHHYSHAAPLGILGTYATNPEVIGVFPELASTVIPHAQEVRVRRGDDLDLDFQLQNDKDPPDVVTADLGVIRWAAKQGFGVTERDGVVIGNEGALIFKRSSDPAQISLAGGGKGTVMIRREDTLGLPLSPAVWDLEVTKGGTEVALPTGAQAQLVANLDMVLAQNFTWPEEILVGDIFEAQGRRVLVTQRVSPTYIRVDWKDWQAQLLPAGSFSIRRGVTKTVASGPFIVEGDVTL